MRAEFSACVGRNSASQGPCSSPCGEESCSPAGRVPGGAAWRTRWRIASRRAIRCLPASLIRGRFLAEMWRMPKMPTPNWIALQGHQKNGQQQGELAGQRATQPSEDSGFPGFRCRRQATIPFIFYFFLAHAARLAAMTDERDQPDSDSDEYQTTEEVQCIAVKSSMNSLGCLAEPVSGIGEGNRPHDRADQVERQKAQPRHVRRTDRKRRDVAQTIIEAEG